MKDITAKRKSLKKKTDKSLLNPDQWNIFSFKYSLFTEIFPPMTSTIPIYCRYFPQTVGIGETSCSQALLACGVGVSADEHYHNIRDQFNTPGTK